MGHDKHFMLIRPCLVCGGHAYSNYDSKDNMWQVVCECGLATQKAHTRKEAIYLWRNVQSETMNTKCPYSKDGICSACHTLKIKCDYEPRFFLCYEYNKAKKAEEKSED